MAFACACLVAAYRSCFLFFWLGWILEWHGYVWFGFVAAAKDLDDCRRRSTLRINAMWASGLFTHIILCRMIFWNRVFTTRTHSILELSFWRSFQKAHRRCLHRVAFALAHPAHDCRSISFCSLAIAVLLPHRTGHVLSGITIAHHLLAPRF